jgi:hypothetical protein
MAFTDRDLLIKMDVTTMPERVIPTVTMQLVWCITIRIYIPL